MGSHNKITEEKYRKIKRLLKTPADDKKAIEKGLCGQTTCRIVRRTKNYREYLHETRKCRHPRKVVTVIKKKQFELKPSDLKLRESYEDARHSMNVLAMIFCVILAILLGSLAWVVFWLLGEGV